MASLPAAELAVLHPLLTSVSMKSGQLIYGQGAQIKSVYFPDTAVLSLLNRMQNNALVEVGTIGNEGMVGLGLFLGATESLSETIAQIPGQSHEMSAASFLMAIDRLPEFRRTIAGCVHAFMAQVGQTAACNRLHGIDERCARWLLLTHDRVGGSDTFPLTHQFLSFMLGVRRAGVTEAIGGLTRAALIKSGAGQITILDRAGLEAASCECYAIVRSNAGEPFAAAAA